MMVTVLGDRKKVQEILFFYLRSSRGSLFIKKCTNSVIQGKKCTFFLSELCETGSSFAVHTLCRRSVDE